MENKFWKASFYFFFKKKLSYLLNDSRLFIYLLSFIPYSLFIIFLHLRHLIAIAQSAGAVEYTDCTSAEV